MSRIKRILDYTFRIAEFALIKVTQFADLYRGYYNHMIMDEASLANISSNDSVLHIGCGAIPNTAVTLAKETGVRVTALDNDPSAVEKATVYIEKENLHNQIRVELGEGSTYPTKNFDIIIISLGVEPITKVLGNIAGSATYDTKVIYRRTRYGEKQQFPLNHFCIEKRVKHHMFRIFSFTEALLLVKKKFPRKN